MSHCVSPVTVSVGSSPATLVVPAAHATHAPDCTRSFAGHPSLSTRTNASWTPVPPTTAPPGAPIATVRPSRDMSTDAPKCSYEYDFPEKGFPAVRYHDPEGAIAREGQGVTKPFPLTRAVDPRPHDCPRVGSKVEIVHDNVTTVVRAGAGAGAVVSRNAYSQAGPIAR
eukprot:31175-Pelagococcus_subviridis.AAC.13